MPFNVISVNRSTSRTFRDDLNLDLQRRSVTDHHHRARHDTAMKHWSLTCANKEAHRIMLKILVSEAFKYHTTGPSSYTDDGVKKEEDHCTIDNAPEDDNPIHVQGEESVPATPTTTTLKKSFNEKMKSTRNKTFQKYQSILEDVDGMMKERDHYAVVLQEIGKMCLFQKLNQKNTLDEETVVALFPSCSSGSNSSDDIHEECF